MGQYRQWLHYREVDQKLQTQRSQLTEELMRLQAQINSVNVSSSTQNTIIEALLHQQRMVASRTQAFPEPNTRNDRRQIEPATTAPATQNIPTAEAVFSALLARSRLPDSSSLEMQTSIPEANAHASSSPTSHAEVALLPEDMTAFVNEHSQTDPQVALPWWLHKTSDERGHDPGDPQSVRTNQLVERWLERWRRNEQPAQSTTVHDPREDQVE